MRYAIKNGAGTLEVREDNGPLPEAALELTEENYHGLTRGELALVDGAVVAATPVVPSASDVIKARIRAIEDLTPFTHRYFREQLLAVVQAGLMPADHPAAARAIAEQRAVVALRDQL